MRWKNILIPAGCVLLVAWSWQHYRWAGLAASVGSLVMWLLLHFTRTLQVLQRASRRPIGTVDSAVMLNARLRPGMTLLHVIAMTRSLGEALSAPDAQPEIYRWTDGGASRVTAQWQRGRLQSWTLERPDAP
ncbi:MAG: glycerate kinase [Rhodoferax sp.]|nr:glycerate kinase [Rhodoferax sp.]